MNKTLILSDTHFCKRSSAIHSIHQLRPLWQGFHTVIFNGDTAEMHSKKYSKKSKLLLRTLLEVTKQDGVKTTLLCGNHDPEISKEDYVWFCKKQILVFHGHAPFLGLAPWSWRSKYIARARKACIRETGDGFTEQLSAVRTASVQSVQSAFNRNRPSVIKRMMLAIPSLFHVLNSWRRFPTLTASWVDQYASSATIIVTGHTHYAGIWKRGNRTIINTGYFGAVGFPNRPRVVIIENDRLSVHRLKKVDGCYSIGRVCKSWDAL